MVPPASEFSTDAGFARSEQVAFSVKSVYPGASPLRQPSEAQLKRMITNVKINSKDQMLRRLYEYKQSREICGVLV